MELDRNGLLKLYTTMTNVQDTPSVLFGLSPPFLVPPLFFGSEILR